MSAVQQGMLWPRSVDEATAMLAADPDARPLAGGATLVAMMNARVLEPQTLVNLARIDELRGIRRRADGGVRIGAFTRHAETAACALLRGPAAVVRQAARRSPTRPSATWERSAARSPSPIPASTIRRRWSRRAPRSRSPVPPGAAGSRRPTSSSTGTRPRSSRRDRHRVLLGATRVGGAAYVKHARVAGDYATASAAVCIDAAGPVRP
jgi:carbon-monoxide dehydrogenase medium subunit